MTSVLQVYLPSWESDPCIHILHLHGWWNDVFRRLQFPKPGTYRRFDTNFFSFFFVFWGTSAPFSYLGLPDILFPNFSFRAPIFKVLIWSKSLTSVQTIFSRFPLCLFTQAFFLRNILSHYNHLSMLCGQPSVLFSEVKMLKVLHYHTMYPLYVNIRIPFIKGKGKAIPLQAWAGPEGSRRLRLPDFKTIGTHEGGKVVSPTHRSPLPPGNIPGTHFC